MYVCVNYTCKSSWNILVIYFCFVGKYWIYKNSFRYELKNSTTLSSYVTIYTAKFLKRIKNLWYDKCNNASIIIIKKVDNNK